LSEETTQYFTASGDDAGMRLDAFLTAKIEGWSRSRLQRLIEDGDVLVGSQQAKASYKLREGDEVEVDLVDVPAAVFEPEDIPLDIVFEDEHLAVINKKAGMIVHPGAGVTGGTLANAVAFKFGVRGSEFRAAHRVGIVHRLDKDTSGLIVVAKNELVHEALAEQFRSREVYKKYVALVHGNLRENSGKIDRPIARDRWKRTKMTVAANGRNALSLWKVRQRFEKFTLLDVEIKTGRTHQIRVHLASMNHPVVGDETYNEGRDKTVADVKVKKAIADLNRVFLHSERVCFTHPETKERLDLTAEMPAELKDFLDLL
jgi:23S rRNA pseudouridine1911/1915/1917 synthase